MLKQRNPIIYLAFSNSEKNRLKTLFEEYEYLHGLFGGKRFMKYGDYILKIEPFATVESLQNTLEVINDQLAVFLFSGHADKHSLFFNDQFANSEVIADYLQRSVKSDTLKLVVLNGCSTRAQVKKLLNIGVPFVVATSSRIEDAAATKFSKKFFFELDSGNKNIVEAFNDAIKETKIHRTSDVEIERGSLLIGEDNEAEPSWGLYYSENANTKINPIPRSLILVDGRDEVLIEVIFDALGEAECKRVLKLIKEEEEGEDEISYLDKRQAVLKSLPRFIGEQIKEITIGGDEKYKDQRDFLTINRLRKITKLFRSITELLVYIFLAQLWEEKLNEKITEVPSRIKSRIMDFFYLTPQQKESYDFIPLITFIREYLESIQGFTFFISQVHGLKNKVNKDQSFRRACDYLFELHKKIDNDSFDENIQLLNRDAEKHLSYFFKELGFLHKYDLVSIQNIHVGQYRHQKVPTYRYNVVKLMRHDLMINDFYTSSKIIDNQAVVLLKDTVMKMQKIEKNGKEIKTRIYEYSDPCYLNLSPFIVDKTSFDIGNKSHLHFFDYFDKSKEEHVYAFKPLRKEGGMPWEVKEKMKGSLDDELRYESITTQFKAFRQQILGEKFENQ